MDGMHSQMRQKESGMAMAYAEREKLEEQHMADRGKCFSLWSSDLHEMLFKLRPVEPVVDSVSINQCVYDKTELVLPSGH